MNGCYRGGKVTLVPGVETEFGDNWKAGPLIYSWFIYFYAHSQTGVWEWDLQTSYLIALSIAGERDASANNHTRNFSCR
jgi:hypothetical protein